MKQILTIMILSIVAILGYSRYQNRQAASAFHEPPSTPASVKHHAPAPPKFKCDGRTYCSEMTSCAEARFFLRNCPNTKMDGDQDGIPCERQWCSY